MLTLVGLAVALLFQRLRGVPDALVFAATVALSARYFGTGPSLLASALSVVAIDLTLLPPLGSIELTHPEELAYLIVFGVLVLVISGTTHSLNRAVETSEQLAARSARLLSVTTALAEAATPVDVARVVLGPGLELTEAGSGLVGVMEGRKLRVLEARRASKVLPTNISLDGDGPLSEALRRRTPVWIPSRENFRENFPAAFDRIQPDSAANAWVAFPLVHGEELVGGLTFGFAARSALGATDRTFVQLLAQSVANAIARARTFEREQTGRMHAETIARAREEVLGVVAHDLRNPLGVVGSVMQVLLELDIAQAERTKLLGTGSRAVQQMNRLIGDLLDVQRLETGHLSLETEDLTVDRVLDEAVEGMRHLARERDIHLAVLRPAQPLHVRADRLRLAQVLGNLLGNAVKFTPKGGVIELKSFNGENEVVFEVSDTGPGVSPEGQVHLFDRFWQEHRADRRGVGLGLPIAKGIVEAHHGRIWVESEPGKGSRFYFAIPTSPAQRGAEVAA